MLKKTRSLAVAVLTALVCTATVHAQVPQSTGPDVIVSAIPGVSNYSENGTTDAISIGTTSCNVGDTPLLWESQNPNHPVIGQHLYRIWEGRIDMIGQSWLKHGFVTINNGICGTCSGPTGAQLYPFCSDPYSSGLNGGQSGLGPKFEVNAHTGAFAYPYNSQGQSGNSIYKRLQFDVNDVSATSFPGARYFVEAHYVAPDDAAANNQNNNTSYREITFSGTTAITGSFSGMPATVEQSSAIEAWPLVDADAEVETVDIPNEGRLHVGFRATNLAGGLTRYVYAVHNLNSHRSVQSVSVAMPAGATVSNVQFSAPRYHSGEPHSNTPWAGSYNGSSVSWATQTFAQNSDANAIRWGTTYTFSFDSNLAPLGTVDLGLFRPGTPSVVQASFVPPVPPPFVITAPSGTPATVLALQETDVVLDVSNAAGAPDPSSAMLFVSVDGAGFQPQAMTHNGGAVYTATLPAAACDATIDWYVAIDAVGSGETVTFPDLAPANFERAVAITDIILMSDDFESDQGWTVVDDAGLTDGGWERATPTSGGTRGDPVADSDGSGQCFLTDDAGPSATNSDVDGGPTTLTSPAMDFSDFGDVVLGFDVWFVNNGNSAVDDVFVIQINDNAGSGWVVVEVLTSSTNGWESRQVNVGQFVSVSDAVQIRFIAQDTPNNSIVECGIDAFSAAACPLLRPDLAEGNVGASAGSPEGVLTVNGSTGGVTRHVIAPMGSPLSFGVAQPSTQGLPASFAIFGRVGVPNPNEAYDVGLGVGEMCFFPCPADASNPLLFELFNNLVGTNCPTLLPATQAPFDVSFAAGINFPFVFTLQGVISDAGASTTGAAPFAVTNAVVYETR